MSAPRGYRQSEKDKYHIISFICGVLKNDTNEHFLQNRNGLADIENKLMVTRGG